jgi:hypothetical protein
MCVLEYITIILQQDKAIPSAVAVTRIPSVIEVLESEIYDAACQQMHFQGNQT